VVNFPAWTPAILENVNINVTIPTGTGETFTNNNTLTIPTNINNNLFGFCYTLNASSGYGFTYNGAGGIFANKFHMNGSGTIPSANLFIYNTSVNTGNTIYAVVLNSAGTIVAQSANLVIAAGDLGTNKNFTFPTPPTFTNEDFYVGMAQPTGGTVAWYPMGTMPEAPYRTNAYYTFAITGGTPSPRTTDVKLMIEAEVAAAQLTAHDVGTQSIDMNRVVALGTITPMATVKNYGANTETFQVNMTISGGYSSTQTVTGLVTGATVQVSFAPWTNTLGDYTVSVCTMLGTDLNESNDCVLNQAVKVVNLNRQVYAYNAFAGAGTDPVGPTTFTLATPGTLNSIANQSTLGFINGGTWANGIWYGTAYSAAAPFNLIRIDPVTGDRTIIGDMGVGTNGISFNPANNTMYAVSATSLYTVNLTTGLATLVGANTGVQMINFAINNSGQAYAVDITNDVLGSVNLTTGIFTGIGPIGFNANYAQDMEFDRDNGDLFMAAYGSYGFLGWVDLTTGAVLKVGNFEGSGEITGLAIPYTSADPLAVTGTPTDVTGCYGNTNGTISTTVTGGTAPYTYLWSNLATTASLSGIGAGTYTVTVTDAALSTATASWTISQPADIIVAGTPVNAACPSSNDGSIDITATGGTAPYTYLWSNSETIEDLTGLAPGTYTVVVTDANNCPKSGSFTVGVNDPVCDNIRLTGNISTTVCYDAHTTITVAGGAYTFSVVSPGHVTMIAGVNILLEPGTHIANGAYLHGYISTTFCTVSDAPMVAAGTGSEQTDLTFAHPNFLLYPNPTSGNFTLVQKGDGQFGNVKVEIYSMRGERVISAHMAGEQRHEFITSELPTGLYFVKVVGENYTETIKLVKSR
jgi:hypothetical protein